MSPAAELTFIHATDFPAPEDALVGGYEIVLESGEKLVVPLHYGQQTRALTDDRPLRDKRASLAWQWTTPKGRVSLFALTTPLSREQEVKRIRFYAVHEEATPLLVALTGVSTIAAAVATETP